MGIGIHNVRIVCRIIIIPLHVFEIAYSYTALAERAVFLFSQSFNLIQSSEAVQGLFDNSYSGLSVDAFLVSLEQIA